PAEQYAIQTGVHPAISTEKNIQMYRTQMKNIGFSYDWSREIKTCDPDYYKWTQWIFIQLFKNYYDLADRSAKSIDELIEYFEDHGSEGHTAFGNLEKEFTASEWQSFNTKKKEDILMNFRLAYRQTTYVNWCEALGTVLANDEVKDGLSERGGHPVVQKPMLQWSLRITAYAERLLNDLKELDWSDSLKTMQENWIGRSEGAQVFFEIAGHDDNIEIFTTRPDTIFGATFMVLAPEHELVESITTNTKEVEAYLEYVKTRTDRERIADTKRVTGAFTGAFAIHPFTGKKLPIWIAEYVLKDYGTGAIMAVPSDDERDQDFAEKFDLDIINVVDKTGYEDSDVHDKVGTMINSGVLNGLEVEEAIKKIIDLIEDKGLGKKKVNYRLRDANFSRQRYWGEPFPIVYDKEGVPETVSLDELPVELPELDDYKPTSEGKSPLARDEEWMNLEDGKKRETDTMPGFAGSSWYYLRFMDPHNEDRFASGKSVDYWKSVDLYIGGTEHAVGHLMYARFWHKFLYDKGYVPTVEPFEKLINQGMIQGLIEYLYLRKEKTNGRSHFMCAGIVKKEGNEEDYIKIPVLIDYVNNYGSPASYLDQNSIDQFIDSRPEFEDAIFECTRGVYVDGKFEAHRPENSDSHLLTHSEIGKMSKSKFNVINPDVVVEEYGADVFRMYEMFLGPIEASKPWDTHGIDGVAKFLRKFIDLFFNDEDQLDVSGDAPSKEELKILHNTIHKIEEDIERFSFNTCVSTFMIAVNDLRKLNSNNRFILTELVKLLAPFAPFTCEELYERLGHDNSIHTTNYPVFDPSKVKEEEVVYPISINGKKRGEATFSADADKAQIENDILENDIVKKWADGKSVKRVIVVPGRMINVVIQ
ncbi:MAG: leucine--tRNA ligase, partial [Saprospiraceae bacterium]|nr:leucine--tRNA ligase [Saprospiraceae bacterium]